MELTAIPVERDLPELVERALEEDLGSGDVTSSSLFGADERCTGSLLLKEAGVVCGLHAAAAVLRTLDPELVFEPLLAEGEEVGFAPAELGRVEGRTRAVLGGERLALNLLGRLSGIATLTRAFVKVVGGTGAVILDTRKTTPGLRPLERYAVRCGGGSNHRAGLFDAVLVKDNHLRLAGGIEEAVRRLRLATELPLEVEVETVAEAERALELGVERILLDNMAVADVRRAVELAAGRARLEVSGGVTLGNVREYAETGADFVSVGAITHSARSLDVSLEIA
ncbi:MAG: carboxylating nicotinate-nucleotide diphosphorylase [Gaiellaceae bacterium]